MPLFCAEAIDFRLKRKYNINRREKCKYALE